MFDLSDMWNKIVQLHTQTQSEVVARDIIKPASTLRDASFLITIMCDFIITTTPLS